MLWVGVLPLNWFGVCVVLTDVAHDFLVQVLGAGENAARDHIALDLGKPDFHLFKPRRVGGGVVNMHIGRQQQPSLDQGCLVAAHVVADRMDFLVLVMIGHPWHTTARNVPCARPLHYPFACPSRFAAQLPTHRCDGFAGSEPELDTWLMRRAYANQLSGAIHTGGV